MKSIVAGLNIGHDGGAAIVIDGVPKCAISEERLTRRKFSAGYANSFLYCLNALDIDIQQLSLVVFSSYGDRLPAGYTGELSHIGIPTRKFQTVDHHLSHAYGSFCLSPFKEALIIVMDGEGNDGDTESYYLGDRNRIERIGGNSGARSTAKGIGRTYEAFTNYLGWPDMEAGKTLGLAGYGDASHVSVPLYSIRGLEVEGSLNRKYDRGVVDFALKHGLKFGPPFSKGTTEASRNIAAYVQRETELVIQELVRRLVQLTGLRKLCLAGGVALNCRANAILLEEGIVDEIFVLPASSDKGQALGNALYGFHSLSGELPKTPIKDDFFGKTYSEQEIVSALELKRDGLVRKSVSYPEFTFEKHAGIERTVARLIADGQMVGWFQGGSELGPRALGHRSILCNPSLGDMPRLLNDHVKKREQFRPYASCCLVESTGEYFSNTCDSPFMTLAATVRPEKAKDIPAVVHVDGTSRVQTVSERENPKLYLLLQEFYRITNIPVLLNTSFNVQEPMVETPGDAVSTFLTSGLDYLALGDYLVQKEKTRRIRNDPTVPDSSICLSE